MEELEQITFFFEEIDSFPIDEDKLTSWIKSIIEKHNYELDQINYIFCDDEYLLQVNKEYLNHDYYTDIITFDLGEEEGLVSSDIFVSIERIKDNAQQLNKPFEEEFLRVLIHGVLHLVGFGDKSEEEEKLMRAKEDEALSLHATN